MQKKLLIPILVVLLLVIVLMVRGCGNKDAGFRPPPPHRQGGQRV